jgi:hypothetical protein
MSNATLTAVPVYFEESWAILSSIDLINVLLGFMIVGITSLSPLSLVPIITSAAGSIANGNLYSLSTTLSGSILEYMLIWTGNSAGLCYYAFYAHHSTTGTVVAAAVADIAWLVSIYI